MPSLLLSNDCDFKFVLINARFRWVSAVCVVGYGVVAQVSMCSSCYGDILPLRPVTRRHTRLGRPGRNRCFAPHQWDDVGLCKILSVTGPIYGGISWNRVSNLEPSSPEAETLPLGHRGSYAPRQTEGK
ncbi:hypothetical protein AVEN_159784-1 [Araneus ventricosus]|uniref:Uncharacterized protein n=1 Tax=Araneus ventricosus TaxID=182803 RepID=A0A4Y2DBA4_ARAVE|nr:hypothetical protein AVEN_159784-1 [Araneus ventricosus]